LELGADTYIEKLFSPEHLQVQIANLTNRNKDQRVLCQLPAGAYKKYGLFQSRRIIFGKNKRMYL
jgi:DNA-binding response OmpR family regulator